MMYENIMRRIKELHGPSFGEWLAFRYCSISNPYTLTFLFLIASMLVFDFIIYDRSDLIQNLTVSGYNLIIMDGILYWWFCQERIMLAARNYRDGKGWENIRQEDVPMH